MSPGGRDMGGHCGAGSYPVEVYRTARTSQTARAMMARTMRTVVSMMVGSLLVAW